MCRVVKAALLLTITYLSCVTTGQAGTAPAQTRTIAAPTNATDLVVFVAKFKRDLYRLVGTEAVPYGTVQFYSPQSIIADRANQCFYVLDEPKLMTETTKIWRVAPDGTGAVVFEAPSTTRGGPFSNPTNLGLDGAGRVLVSDSVTGLWRLESNGFLRRVLDGKDKPLYKITASTGCAGSVLLVGTSYMHEVTGGQMLNFSHDRWRSETWSPSPHFTNDALVQYNLFRGRAPVIDHTGVGNSTGRQVPIRIWKNQGGLYVLDISGPQARYARSVINKEPGGAEHETLWRTLKQLFVDAHGRLILIDAGSEKTRTERVYIGPGYSSNPRVTKSVINGGIFVLHPDGRLENLTFKNPQQSSGPMRRPYGAAQWSDDTYIVADPEMYVKGVNGTGGLLLLKLDGSREARWPFGYRIKPVGVAVLRGAGQPAQAAVEREVRLVDLGGIQKGGPITSIGSVSWEVQPANTNNPLAGIGMNWQKQPRAASEAKIRSLFEGAAWRFTKDGAAAFCANGVNPQQQGTPFVMRGEIAVHGGVATAQLSYKSASMFDTQLGSLDVRIRSTQPGQYTMHVTATIFTKTERLKAAFVQVAQ